MPQHKYDRHKPEALLPSKMLSKVSRTMPTVVDLRASCGPTKDQGNEGACTAHGGTSDGEWIYRKYFKKQPIFSPGYLYSKELIAQGNFPQDAGSDGTTLCECVVANGLCELSAMPYVPGQIVAPTPEQDANAATFRLNRAYHGLTSNQVALSVLGDPTPWPVLVGFDVYDSFESTTGQTGIYNPAPSESVLGGHEVLAVGYDIGGTPTLRPAGCPPAVLIQNSWGTGWGWQGGFFWMALPVLDDPDTDLKIFHAGNPWK